jgi:hypothetical protein
MLATELAPHQHAALLRELVSDPVQRVGRKGLVPPAVSRSAAESS